MIENKYVITYMHIEKITTKTLRQQIYDQLRKKIIAAEILPGQVVTIQGLAKQFEVSVMPVREALWQLESEGVVVIESNKSIHVNALRRNEMEEILDLRLILEAIAARKGLQPHNGAGTAAENGKSPQRDEEGLRETR